MSAVEASSHLRDFLRIKEEDVGGAGAAVCSQPRDLAGLTLVDVLRGERVRAPPASPNVSARLSLTLQDIIRGDDPDVAGQNQKDRMSWKSLRDMLRRRRSSPALTSTMGSPTTDFVPRSCWSPTRDSVLLGSPNRSNIIASEQTRVATRLENLLVLEGNCGPSYQELGGSTPTRTPSTARRTSTTFGSLVPISAGTESTPPAASPEQAPQPPTSPNNSTRFAASPIELSRSQSDGTWRSHDQNAADVNGMPHPEEPAREPARCLSAVLAEERQLSAREAMEAVAEEAVEQAGPSQMEPARMSLMELLEETDRQISFDGGTMVAVGDDKEEAEEGCRRGIGGENDCCICMVRNKGAAFIPCGHTFCRLCSRELWVSRGNCPLCNKFISEVLDIF